MFEVTNDTNRRTVTARLSGFVRPNEMKDFAAAYKTATDVYGGGRHLVLADMRGLRTLEPESAAIFGEVVAYGRQRGCLMCAHVSDSTIARLQTARVASEAAPGDDITVDCVSLEEAHTQLAKARAKHFLGTEPVPMAQAAAR
ncbi:hypothetical protein JY651_36135 [Pyxidicoccus parkwayensis]|uniref:STAS domain-containing protein n=1 Tax=Pyxidicoccus parkwayensis TaxID=2813578 RepID=A0ABX7NPJ9_9BACT|nr:hypothetical protein [Pyxidicoccus parkwaysis]QSQ20628.1 hypothetical protein JY651_36135 [Pyxidicoccus parkwaysis]